MGDEDHTGPGGDEVHGRRQSKYSEARPNRGPLSPPDEGDSARDGPQPARLAPPGGGAVPF